MTSEFAEEKKNHTTECEHQYTFRVEELFREVNALFSHKTCEKCGKEIALSRKSKLGIILFSVVLVLLFFLAVMQIKQVLPGISYGAKALILVLLFCVALTIGLYRLMNNATYVTYQRVQTSSRYRDAYEEARRENDERTRRKYAEAAERRQKKWEEKQIQKGK